MVFCECGRLKLVVESRSPRKGPVRAGEQTVERKMVYGCFSEDTLIGIGKKGLTSPGGRGGLSQDGTERGQRKAGHQGLTGPTGWGHGRAKMGAPSKRRPSSFACWVEGR